MSFFTKRLENGGSAMEYLSFLEETVAALREAGESISDRILVVITLKGLPQRYKSFIDVANQRNPPYDYCGLKTVILTYEDTLKGNSDTERVMVAQGNNTFKQKRCFKCGEPGHFASKCYKGGEYKRGNNLNKPQNVKKWCELHNSRTHNTSECRTKNPKRSNNSVNSADDTSEPQNYEYSFHVTRSRL